jgi:hypothetical protein
MRHLTKLLQEIFRAPVRVHVGVDITNEHQKLHAREEAQRLRAAVEALEIEGNFTAAMHQPPTSAHSRDG